MFPKKAFQLIVVFLMALLMVAPGTKAQRKKQIAVLDFDFATVDIGLAHRAYGSQQNLARRVADKLVTSMVALGNCQVIERSQLERVLREQNLGIDGRIDPSTAAKLGRVLGVDALIIGNVSVFDLTGLPKDSRDVYWNPRDMRARIAVNFRIVDTTTAVVEASNEMIGMSVGPPKQSAKGKFAGDLITGILTPKNQTVQVKDEQIRDVVQQAVDDVVGKITVDVEKYLSGTRRQPDTPATEKQINGRVIEVNGPTVFIMDINKSIVRIGDRLFVRRGRVKRDPVTGKEIKFTDRVGEVEVVEIQDEVVVGSFSGSMAVQINDLVTNNPGGAIPPTISGTKTSSASQIVPRSPDNSTSSTGGIGKQVRTFTVPANQPWFDTGIEVQPNTNYEFIAEGVSSVDRVNKVSPAGIPVSSSRRLPLLGSPLGALLVKVRYPNGQYSAIVLAGAKGSAKTDPGETGRLMLGINDDNFTDNTGSFKVTVRW